MKLIDGKEVAGDILKSLKKEVSALKGRPPGLAFVLIGDHLASRTYVRMKKKKCAEVGFFSKDIELRENVSAKVLEKTIKALNKDKKIDGILIQMPLPKHLDSFFFTSLIDPDKDVDGFHPTNIGKLLLGNFEGFIPCTPYGIFQLLKTHNIPLEDKHVVIVGRSNIVGKPLAVLLMQKHKNANATVTVAHSKTKNLAGLCQSADVLIAALGHPKFIRKNFVKKGAIVIDVGINRSLDSSGKASICGDVDFDEVAPLCTLITPVPGGVGPMTIAMLLVNTFTSFLKKNKAARSKHLLFSDNILERF